MKSKVDIAVDAMDNKIKDAIMANGQKKVYVSYSAYASFTGKDDDIPIDNLDEIAVTGKIRLVRDADEYWGGNKSENYRSEILENPTWLQVTVCANAMIKKTRDRHHCFLECLDKIGEEADVNGFVTIYAFGMGS